MLDDIARYLQDNSVGTVGTNIFKSYVPKTPDNLVAVIDTGGPEQDPDIPHEFATFQVFVRNSNYQLGRAKVDAVMDALHITRNRTIGTHYYYYILAVSRGGHIGRNPDNGLEEFTINFRCRIL
jgi:hypothetical protein